MKTVLNRSDFERLRANWINESHKARQRGEHLQFPLWAKITIMLKHPVHNLVTMRRVMKHLLGGEPFYLDYVYKGENHVADRTEFILHTTENYKRFLTWCRLKGFEPTISDTPSQMWLNGRVVEIPSAWCYVIWSEDTDPFATIVRSINVMKNKK